VRVCNNGVGIAPERMRNIFDRFYQVDATRSRSEKMESDVSGQVSTGTGLGLAIAQWIAHAHYGEIRVESTMEQGSTFEGVLPAYNHSE
jgi:signal transduction histidine kinase